MVPEVTQVAVICGIVLQKYCLNQFCLSVRERPFNLKGGGVWFFSKKNILIPNVAEKNILIMVEGKKMNLIQRFCHIT